MKVLVTGDRNWRNKDRIREILSALDDVECVVEGEARGADTLAREVATDLGIEVHGYHAQWDKYGRSAGPVRNRQMLNDEKPDLVIAFHNDICHSKGTRDMVLYARSKGVATRIYTEFGRYEGEV